MRVHINKGLRARCKAIQNALRKYNAIAAKIDRPVLDWKCISTYGSLAEFSLLRECHKDIRSQPWAQAANRQAGVHSLKLARLNIEVRHVATSIRDEELDFQLHITWVEATDPPLAAELRDIWDRRIRVNRLHKLHIAEIHNLHSFNGDLSIGTCVGRASIGTDVDMDSSQDQGGIDVDLDDAEPDEDDVIADHLNSLEMFFQQLSVRAATEDQ